ncbi:hypothetical protein vBCbaSRXM_59 [Citromicrobium phage vB_CbaS-RXM]|nr:hypothetical protein vBCbaSRXM_59 [Citromicrobium phage vB_CbaS-RXM]
MSVPDDLAKSKAPPVPEETCPACDRLSVQLDAIGGDLETYLEDTRSRKRRTVDRAEMEDLLHQTVQNLARARRLVEELRVSNEALRASGRYWRVAHRELAEKMQVSS